MKTASFKTYAGEGRVCIARYAPRQTPGGYRMFKRLAPGTWFNSVSREEYSRLFKLEVLDQLDAAETLDQLIQLTGGKEPILLCYETPPFTPTNWCHRRMVAAWFEEKLGIHVPELGYENEAKQTELFTHTRART